MNVRPCNFSIFTRDNRGETCYANLLLLVHGYFSSVKEVSFFYFLRPLQVPKKKIKKSYFGPQSTINFLFVQKGRNSCANRSSLKATFKKRRRGRNITGKKYGKSRLASKRMSGNDPHACRERGQG